MSMKGSSPHATLRSKSSKNLAGEKATQTWMPDPTVHMSARTLPSRALALRISIGAGARKEALAPALAEAEAEALAEALAEAEAEAEEAEEAAAAAAAEE